MVTDLGLIPESCHTQYILSSLKVKPDKTLSMFMISHAILYFLFVTKQSQSHSFVKVQVEFVLLIYFLFLKAWAASRFQVAEYKRVCSFGKHPSQSQRPEIGGGLRPVSHDIHMPAIQVTLDNTTFVHPCRCRMQEFKSLSPNCQLPKSHHHKF